MRVTDATFEYNINNFALTGGQGMSHIDGAIPHSFDNYEPVWVRCKTCYMFMPIENFQLLAAQQSGWCEGGSQIYWINCTKCLQNDALSQEVHNLKVTVAGQEERICKLKEIKHLECELDDTLNEITNKVAVLDIDDEKIDSVDDRPVARRTRAGSSRNNPDAPSKKDKKLKKTVAHKGNQTTASQFSSQGIENSCTETNIPLSDAGIQTENIVPGPSNPTGLASDAPPVSDVPPVKPTAKEARCQTDSINNIDQTAQTDSISSADARIQTDDTNTDKSSQTVMKIHPHLVDQAAQAQNNYYSDITALLIGDEALTKLKSSSLTSKYGKVLKIVRPGGSLVDIRETTGFYLEKLPNVKTVIFHFSTSVLIKGQTQRIKRNINLLQVVVKSYQANLVISGPIPDPSMSNETFSRSQAVNNWLSSLKQQRDLVLLRNFQQFWKRNNLFDGRSSVLSHLGAKRLAMNLLRTPDL